jgi:hypothetical protein
MLKELNMQKAKQKAKDAETVKGLLRQSSSSSSGSNDPPTITPIMPTPTWCFGTKRVLLRDVVESKLSEVKNWGEMQGRTKQMEIDQLTKKLKKMQDDTKPGLVEKNDGPGGYDPIQYGDQGAGVIWRARGKGKGAPTTATENEHEEVSPPFVGKKNFKKDIVEEARKVIDEHCFLALAMQKKEVDIAIDAMIVEKGDHATIKHRAYIKRMVSTCIAYANGDDPEGLAYANGEELRWESIVHVWNTRVERIRATQLLQQTACPPPYCPDVAGAADEALAKALSELEKSRIIWEDAKRLRRLSALKGGFGNVEGNCEADGDTCDQGTCGEERGIMAHLKQ